MSSELITMRSLPLLLLLAGLAGCAALPPGDATRPATTTPGNGDATAASGSAEAVGELVASSRASRASGEPAQAMADIERAIRIEPRNPYLWIELGEIHLSQGDASQAAAMARKAMSIAGTDDAARAAAGRLLEQASR